MLFNSYAFLLFFLPVVCVLFYLFGSAGAFRAGAALLAAASVIFYGYWSADYVALLLVSIAINYTSGLLILNAASKGNRRLMKGVLVAAITINLGLLAYFKYANFLVSTLDQLTSLDVQLARIVLPIGISFYTFTQIAFLVDTYQGKVREARFLPYLLFVTYFPHLVAGPVLHHAEMMPQFARRETYRLQLPNLLSGLLLLSIGLFKKVVLADGIQPFVVRGFDTAAVQALSGIEAWGAALAYSMQLYFDFSGYSDMAIGISRMFNVELPLNFNSPYKSRSIIDFWRRWHMTLSRFLRDYLYIPLGGSRLGIVRQYVNLMITMLLGGLWHGAGWTFVFWGGLHGLYLVANHLWRALASRLRLAQIARVPWLTAALSAALTFVCVVVAWTFFRAQTFDQALGLLRSMAGMNGWTLPMEWMPAAGTLPGGWTPALHFGALNAFAGITQMLWIFILLLIAFAAPNSQEIMQTLTARRVFERPRTQSWVFCGALIAVLFWLATINGSRAMSEFIYFNF